jgi:hypothetical protein
MPQIGYNAMVSTRPGRTEPLTPSLVEDDLTLPAAGVDGDVDGLPENQPVGVDGLPENRVSPLSVLGAAKTGVDEAVDALAAQYVKDGTVTRVGVARLRDAIDVLRQSIPRQTSRRRSGV